MTPAPETESYDLSRILHRPRPNRHAQIQISQERTLREANGNNPKRQKDRKTNVEFTPSSHARTACPVKSSATAHRKSP